MGEALGPRTYLVLLRELYTLLGLTLREALAEIKEIAPTIEEYDFLQKDEIDVVREMEAGKDLSTFDSEWVLQIGPLRLSP